MTARILLAEDHALVRAGLRPILEAEHDFEVVAEASDGMEAVAKARSRPFDLAVLDGPGDQHARARLPGADAPR